MNWKIIFNPFEKFSEITLLIFGIIITLIGSWISYHFGVIFDGIFDAHISEITFGQSLLTNIFNIISVVIVLFILGKIINPKTRFVDIINIAMISRIPIYILGIFTNNEKMNSITDKLINGINNPKTIPISSEELALLLIFSVVGLMAIAYMIVLLVFGFRTATNVKKPQHWVFFAFALIVAEIISKFLMDII